jgi:hypothetical protein
MPIEWVSKDIIRQIFNDGQFYEKTLSGELRAVVKKDSHPATPPGGEPVCTRSQIVFYYGPRRAIVAIVHQYLRRDGTIGASGRPDPKRLFLPDRILSVRSD